MLCDFLVVAKSPIRPRSCSKNYSFLTHPLYLCNRWSRGSSGRCARARTASATRPRGATAWGCRPPGRRSRSSSPTRSGWSPWPAPASATTWTPSPGCRTCRGARLSHPAHVEVRCAGARLGGVDARGAAGPVFGFHFIDELRSAYCHSHFVALRWALRLRRRGPWVLCALSPSPVAETMFLSEMVESKSTEYTFLRREHAAFISIINY